MAALRNIFDVLRTPHGRRLSQKIAVRCGQKALSYGQLASEAARVGNGLTKLGLAQGDRVALLLLDSPEFISAFQGAMAFGFVPVCLNTTLSAADYQQLLARSEAKVLLVHSLLFPLIQTVVPLCPTLSQTIVVGEPLAYQKHWDAWLNENTSEPAGTDLPPKAPAFWLFSSGSGGNPKAVVHLQGSILKTCEQYAQQVLGLREDDICFSAAKLFHAYGLGNGMNFPLSVGATSVLWPGPAMAEPLLEVITREKPSVFFGTPSHFVAILGYPDLETKYSLKSLRFCVSAGEALPGATAIRWKERFGLDILDGIGSTEMLHIFISNRAGEVRPGSSGTPVPGYELRILDEAMRDVLPGEIGDLWVRGESRMLEYWKDPAQTNAVILDGWVRTGDKYCQDEEGYFWYRGRSDDMLKVNGVWVSPTELEQILLHHPAVQEAAVIGIPDADGLMQIKAFVVPRAVEGTPELAKELRAFAKKRAPGRYPKTFQFLETLPKTATGKVKRAKLREAEVAA